MSNFTWNPGVLDEAAALAGAGLRAATIFVTNQTKEVLSVPAPRVSFIDKHGGRITRAGWKVRDQSYLLSPYRPGSRVTTQASYKFPAGQQGPPTKTSQQYRTAPAIPGDPPRKLTGNLRRSMTYEMLDPQRLFENTTPVPTRGRVGTNTKYAKPLEFHKNHHEFLSRVVNKFAPQIEAIIAGSV